MPVSTTCRYDVGSSNSSPPSAACTRPAVPSLYNFCPEHFVELWWTGKERHHKDAASWKSPDQDLRAMTAGNWTFSVAARIDDPDYLMKSFKFTVRKIASSALGRQFLQRPPLGFGHSYLFLSDGTRKWSFGFLSAGVESPDPEVRFGGRHLAVDYAITVAQKNRICDVITRFLVGSKLREDDLSYGLMSTNCTVFVREACKAANIHFVGNRIPSYSRNHGGLNLSFSPNNLFSSLEAMGEFNYDPTTGKAALNSPHGLVESVVARLKPAWAQSTPVELP